MSKNTNNKKMLKMQELQELQQQFEGIETENSKLTNVIGKIKQEINWYSTYLNKCKKENPTTFNRVINGTFDGSEGINMIDLELNNSANGAKKISKKQVKNMNTTAMTSKKNSVYASTGLANGFDDIDIDLGFLENDNNKTSAINTDIIVEDLYFDTNILANNNSNSAYKLDSLSNSHLNLGQLGFNTNNSTILQQVQQFQDQKTNSRAGMNKDEMMLMNSLKDALNNI
ncbi:hypothetical protein QEN19_002826 [Hanseniaspora menglaensis]